MGAYVHKFVDNVEFESVLLAVYGVFCRVVEVKLKTPGCEIGHLIVEKLYSSSRHEVVAIIKPNLVGGACPGVLGHLLPIFRVLMLII